MSTGVGADGDTRSALERNRFKLRQLALQDLMKHDLFGKPASTFPNHALARRLFCSRRERRQFVDVAGVVLDDHGGVEVLCDLLHPLDRGDGLRAIGVEVRHAL